jgi:nucleotide-binding universal stress UspA family protein
MQVYDKILVPLDGSKQAECVIPHVLEITRGNKSAQVILLRVCEPVSLLADFPADMKEPWDEHVKAINDATARQCSVYLDNVEERLKVEGLSNIKVVGRIGNPELEILDYIEKNDIDLVIMSSHGHSGTRRWAFGNVADKITHASPVSVLVVRETE